MKINHLQFKYYEQSTNIVIDNVSFDVKTGTISLLIGKSGSGKSTLAYIMAGMYPSNAGILMRGDISVDGEDILNMQPDQRAKLITMMFQNPSMQFCMQNLREELIFCLENLGLLTDQIDERIKNACDFLGTNELLSKNFEMLSGGEKQKCALTCIVAMESKYVILDEPFANIDPKSATELVKLIDQLNKKYGTTFIVVDHKIKRWLDVVDQIYFLQSAQNLFVTDINSKNYSQNIPFFRENKIEIEERIQTSRVELSSNALMTFQNVTLENSDRKLLKSLNITVKKGETLAIIGESGCGKTTLLKSIYNKAKFQGEIVIDGLKVCRRNYKKICKKVGIVLQNPMNQFVTQKVIDEVKFSMAEEDYHKVEEYMKDFGLFKYQNYSPYMLSQGQQRRLAVLCVICAKKDILILDEPTYGQDLDSTNAIMQFIYQKAEENALTVILSTHDLSLASKYANTILEFNKGGNYEIFR